MTTANKDQEMSLKVWEKLEELGNIQYMKTSISLQLTALKVDKPLDMFCMYYTPTLVGIKSNLSLKTITF